jgi:alpha-methylacyl-CoA racemase
VTPILNMDEAKEDEHNIARNAFVDIDGFTQPAPAPRFSVDKLSIKHNSKIIGSDVDDICNEYNLDRKAFI